MTFSSIKFGGFFRSLFVLLLIGGMRSVHGEEIVVDASVLPGADAGAKIEAALNLLPLSGGTVDARALIGAQSINKTLLIGSTDRPVTLLLGTTTYTITTVAFTLGSNSAILGNGLTTLVQAAGANQKAMINGSNVTNGEIAGLILDGNKAQNTEPGSGIDLSVAIKCSVHDNTIRNTTGGFYPAIRFSDWGNSYDVVTYNTIEDVGTRVTSYADGIYLSGPGHSVTHNTIRNISDTGVVCEACTDGVIALNTLEDAPSAIAVGSAFNRPAGNMVINGNTIKGGFATTQGVINLYHQGTGATSTISVTGNVITDVDQGNGIWVQGQENFTITGNTLTNVAIDQSVYGILIRESQRGVVSGNNLYRIGSYGIGVGGSSALQISSNIIIDAARSNPAASGIGFDVLAQKSTAVNITGNTIYDTNPNIDLKSMSFCIDFGQGGMTNGIGLWGNLYFDGVNSRGCRNGNVSTINAFNLNPSTDTTTLSPPTMYFVAAIYTVQENLGLLRVTVRLSEPLGRPLVVAYTTKDNTATAGSDYESAVGSITFPTGATEESFTIPIDEDNIPEGEESFFVILQPTVGVDLGNPSYTTVKITDNDQALPPKPGVGFSQALYDVQEGGGTASIPVSLTEASTQTVKVTYATSDESATANQDYTPASGTLVFAPGETLKNISVPLLQDTVVEDNESLRLTLSAPENAYLAGGSQTTLLIHDDDLPTVQFSQKEVHTPEAGGGALLQLVLNAPSTKAVSIHYATVAGSAQAGLDYLSRDEVLTFMPGEVSRTVQIPVLPDEELEGDETLQVVLSDPINAVLGATTSAQVVITDATALPQIHLSASAYSQTEGAPGQTVPATITVSLDDPSNVPVTIHYGVVDGTARADQSDYTPTSGTLTFAPGDTAKSFQVPILGDARDEYDETVRVSISSPVGASLAEPSSATLTILNSSPPPEMAFSDDVYNVSEPAGSATIPVDLRLPSDKVVTVRYLVEDGSADPANHIGGASAGVNYVPVFGTLIFKPGVISQLINIGLLNDNQADPSARVRAHLVLFDQTDATLVRSEAFLIWQANITPTPSLLQGIDPSQCAVSATNAPVVLHFSHSMDPSSLQFEADGEWGPSATEQLDPLGSPYSPRRWTARASTWDANQRVCTLQHVPFANTAATTPHLFRLRAVLDALQQPYQLSDGQTAERVWLTGAPLMKGDLNGDGLVDAKDVALTVQGFLRSEPLSGLAGCAEVSPSGATPLNASDVNAFLRSFLLGP